MRDQLEKLLQESLVALKATGQLSIELPVTLQIERTRDPLHGEFASNAALILAKSVGMKPYDLAKLIIAAIPAHVAVAKVEIAGPGFINFFLQTSALFSPVRDILSQQSAYGRSTVGNKKRVMVEFVSSNPTGPLHVGHGRGAVLGSVIANLLEAVGFSVHREYYVNDAGRQMAILAASVYLRYLEARGIAVIFPSNAYRGEYVLDIAQRWFLQRGEQDVRPWEGIIQGVPADEPQGGDKEKHIDGIIVSCRRVLTPAVFEELLTFTLMIVLQDIREDLQEFGVTFDEWFSEKSLLANETVQKGVALLKEKNLLYEQEGAWWFTSAKFGDEKDRVVVRANGEYTYFAADLFYHLNKLQRGFEILLDIWGSDHHGYAPRITAGLRGLGQDADCFKVLLVQFATLYRHGEKVQMSTRSGSFVTLRELREEVGTDAARFFYVMRKSEQHMDFDLDLAKSQSNDNPLYYIQYAYARICSVFRQLTERGLTHDEALGMNHLELLVEESERALLMRLAHYSEMLQVAALQYEPYLFANYLRDLAHDFHVYYNACPFLLEDAALRNARLNLIKATRWLIANGLALMGVSVREKM